MSGIAYGISDIAGLHDLSLEAFGKNHRVISLSQDKYIPMVSAHVRSIDPSCKPDRMVTIFLEHLRDEPQHVLLRRMRLLDEPEHPRCCLVLAERVKMLKQ